MLGRNRRRLVLLAQNELRIVPSWGIMRGYGSEVRGVGVTRGMCTKAPPPPPPPTSPPSSSSSPPSSSSFVPKSKRDTPEKAKIRETIEKFKIRPHVKMKPPQRRASSILSALKKEEFDKLRAGREWPEINAGDSIEVTRLPFKTAKMPDIIRGVVIGKYKKNSDTSIMMMNSEFGIPVGRKITLYNPLIQDIKVLQRAFIHEGKKRVRRGKLYYLLKRDPKEYTVKYDDLSAEEKKNRES